MRLFLLWGAFLGVVTGVSLGGATMARSETVLDRETCVKLAEQKDRIDNTNLPKYLAMSPAQVQSQYGQATIRQVRDYIALSEKVLFRCPVNILNGAAAAIDESGGPASGPPPPLPVKGPKRVRVELPRGTVIPLPVKRRRSGARLSPSRG